MKKKIISTYALTFCLGIVSATAAVTPPNANQVVAPKPVPQMSPYGTS